jgi:hypothetical protein
MEDERLRARLRLTADTRPVPDPEIYGSWTTAA